MKFSYVIGNPPYHKENGRKKIAIYDDFIVGLTGNDAISDKVCLITPDGFIKGGEQLESLRNHMIETKHLTNVEFHQDAVFNDASVNAAITLFNNKIQTNTIQKTIIYENKKYEKGLLNWKHREVVIDETKYKILDLFSSKCYTDNNMSLIIPSIRAFYLEFNSKCYKENIEKFSKTKKEGQIKCLVGDKQDFYYIYLNEQFKYNSSTSEPLTFSISTNQLNKYKVAFAKAGSIKDKPMTTYILLPNEVCINKFIFISLDTYEEAINAEKYFNSKFYRAGLASKMTSWNMYAQWHSNIPIQDFTNNSDIDWSKSSHEIDLQLYKKYNFTEEEIQAIEEYIK